MTSGHHQGSQGSILEISPRRSVKSSPVSLRTQSGRHSCAFLHSLGHGRPSSHVNGASGPPNSGRARMTAGHSGFGCRMSLRGNLQ
jgi:hypothetical protein